MVCIRVARSSMMAAKSEMNTHGLLKYVCIRVARHLFHGFLQCAFISRSTSRILLSGLITAPLLCYGLVAAQTARDDPFGPQQCHILSSVNEIIHKVDKCHDFISGAWVQPLKCHQVEKHALGIVPEEDPRNTEYTSFKADPPYKSLSITQLEMNSCLVEFCRTRHDKICGQPSAVPTGTTGAFLESMEGMEAQGIIIFHEAQRIIIN
ncbi:Os11g0540901 [Oryza sativa Japonica Group]|uniref:Os11g0540901 protein n=1 Tax=Oryza sativa subsp. japonica TaxID=39947 RepID=A0A0P0Y3B5_ORYSJ|nr:Os11g0540901 [Oryza sativa Japonica Group]